MLKEYARRGMLHEEFTENYRAHGEQEIPEPRPHEAVVFRDFFVAGLRFPGKRFVVEVLSLFNVAMHQLTSNAFAWLSIFVMALKMMGFSPSAALCAFLRNATGKKEEEGDRPRDGGE